MTDNPAFVVLEDVSKFYGDILGVNRVSLCLPAGITSLVGPNGSGKTTLLNLMAGLLRPTRGRVEILGTTPAEPHRHYRKLGYCTQFDTFPPGVTGARLLASLLQIRGFTSPEAARVTGDCLERLGLSQAALQKVAGYSKGMKQRLKLALALAHDPSVLLLDEPLNGLDPMARAETISLFTELADQGRCLVLSSHILHEVDQISGRVVMIDSGYVIAEGDIRSVRSEMPEHPIQVLIRCNSPARLASRLFEADHLVEARVQDDGRGLLVRTRHAENFYRHLNRAVLEMDLEIEMVRPADEDAGSVYEYLIAGTDGGKRS